MHRHAGSHSVYTHTVYIHTHTHLKPYINIDIEPQAAMAVSHHLPSSHDRWKTQVELEFLFPGSWGTDSV